MFTLLLGLLILCGIFIMVIVLLQAGKGGGLAAMGGGMGTETFIGGRQAATLLVKSTWAGGALFLALALALSVLSSRQQQPDSILQQEFRQTQPGTGTPQPVLPGAQPGEQPGEQPGAGAAPGQEPGATPPPDRD